MAGMCAPEHYGIYKYSRFYGASGYPTGVTPSRYTPRSVEDYCLRRPTSRQTMRHVYQPSTGYGLRPSTAAPGGIADYPESGSQIVGRTVHPNYVIHPDWKSERLPKQIEQHQWHVKYGHLLV